MTKFYSLGPNKITNQIAFRRLQRSPAIKQKKCNVNGNNCCFSSVNCEAFKFFAFYFIFCSLPLLNLPKFELNIQNGLGSFVEYERKGYHTHFVSKLSRNHSRLEGRGLALKKKKAFPLEIQLHFPSITLAKIQGYYGAGRLRKSAQGKRQQLYEL